MTEAHVRIDEGLKRGPKRTVVKPYRRNPETGAAEGIPADLDPKMVLDLYLQHPTTSGIAQKLGLRRSSLTLWLRKTCPEDWKNVQICKALMRKEDGDEGLETAPDALSLARAREMLKSGQWDLERLDSDTYGQKIQSLSVVVQVSADELVESAETLLKSVASRSQGAIAAVQDEQIIEGTVLNTMQAIDPE